MELKLKNNRKVKLKFSISKKEKNLLILLITAIIIWIFYKFIISVQAESIIELKKSKETYENELIRIGNILEKEELIKNQWTKLNGEFDEVSKIYFSDINQPEIMHILNEIIDNGRLKVPSMSFIGPDYIQMNNMDSKYIGINLPFEGSYKDLDLFFTQLRNSSKKLLVTQLSLSNDNEDTLKGQISLNAFSYGNENIGQGGYFYNNSSDNKENPFKPFEGYIDKEEIAETFEDVGSEEEKRAILDDLESGDTYFIGTSYTVTGKVNKLNKPKYGKTSVRAEYFISTDFKAEKAYVVLDDRNIVLKYPPDSIGLWVYAYGYSPITIGFRFQNMDDKKIDLELTRGVNWTGWEYISASPPKDINIYPLKLDRIYFELGPNRDDYGVMLFDRIECSYSKEEKEENDNLSLNYVFYVVKPGDTLMSISEKFYGTNSKYNKIMQDNGLKSDSDLETGKVLVISK